MSDYGRRGIAFWAMQGPGWALVLSLVYAQAIAAFSYELGVRMGTQESAEAITAVWGALGLWPVAFRPHRSNSGNSPESP